MLILLNRLAANPDDQRGQRVPVLGVTARREGFSSKHPPRDFQDPCLAQDDQAEKEGKLQVYDHFKNPLATFLMPCKHNFMYSKDDN